MFSFGDYTCELAAEEQTTLRGSKGTWLLTWSRERVAAPKLLVPQRAAEQNLGTCRKCPFQSRDQQSSILS
ncbi:hypothetical protein GN956_G1573 [Arapaima gigas]